MPNNCAVYGYNNNKKKAYDQQISYFKFPKYNDTKAKWIHSCYRSDYFNTKHAVIYFILFRDEDYEDDLKAFLRRN